MVRKVRAMRPCASFTWGCCSCYVHTFARKHPCTHLSKHTRILASEARNGASALCPDRATGWLVLSGTSFVGGMATVAPGNALPRRPTPRLRNTALRAMCSRCTLDARVTRRRCPLNVHCGLPSSMPHARAPQGFTPSARSTPTAARRRRTTSAPRPSAAPPARRSAWRGARR